MSKKPKFRVGQVVCRTDGVFPRFLVVRKVYPSMVDLSNGLTIPKESVRPLTKRERGAA